MDDRSKDDLPTVSVILPVRNEQHSIEPCLLSIFEQTYPEDLIEILIADGLSSDKTKRVIEDLCHTNSKDNVTIFDNDGKIVPTGLNKLLRMASGEIIIRVDGHTILDREYISNCVSYLETRGIENVGGRMNAVGENFIGKAIALATSSPFGVGGALFHYSEKEEFVDTVYLGAWPRRVFQEIGGFDEELVRNQDDEFNYRLRANGGKILLSPKIKSVYSPRSTLNKLFLQYFQYGFWKVRVLQKHLFQMRPRQFIPFVFVSSLLFLIFLSIIFPWGWILLAALSGMYLVANTAASGIISRKEGGRYFLILPVVFFILHFSYGLGFLFGLFKFWNRWSDKEGKVPKYEFA